MTLVSVMEGKFIRSFPELDPEKPIRACDRAYLLPLGEALEREYRTDAHFVPYRTPNGHRLNHKAFEHGISVELGALVFDIDCPLTHGTSEPAPEAWRREIREKVRAFAELHPDPYFYETKGGGRLIYRQEDPTILQVPLDSKEWSQNYAIAVAYLKRTVELVADSACSDWQRLYRLPHATRGEGKPENWPVFGNPDRIGDLFIRATTEDMDAAKRATTAFRKKREPQTPAAGVGGDGLFYHALRLRGHAGAWVPRAGGWVALCPNRSSHTSDTDWTASTIVVPPDAGQELGLILCKHAHCWERFTIKEWLRFFGDSELDAARDAAGIKRRESRAA